MKKLTIFLVLFLLAWPTIAQDTTGKTYASDDGAVQFTYPQEWTIEEQVSTFNQRYLYALWTDSTAISSFLGNDKRSRILVEIVNRHTANYPDKLPAPLDYAAYALAITDPDDALTHQDFAVTPNTLSDEFLNDAQKNNSDKGKFNTIIIKPTWFTATPSKIQDIKIAGNTGARIMLDFPPAANRLSALDVFVRDDGWLVLASINTPIGELTNGERVLFQMLSSLEFDANKAAIPFKRDLKTYDASHIKLSQTATTTDGNLTFRYPGNWQVTLDQPYGDVPAMYFIEFETSKKNTEATIQVMVINTTSDTIGLPLNQNSSQEYLQEQRRKAATNGSQFRIGDYDAVSVEQKNQDNLPQEVITFALNDIWIANGMITAKTQALVSRYEASLVAVLGSLKFALGGSVIDSSVLQVDLPVDWKLAAVYQDANKYYEYILHPPTLKKTSGNHLVIEIVNLIAVGFPEGVNENDFKSILSQIVDSTGQSQMITINHHKALRAQTVLNNGDTYGEHTLYMIDDKWLVAIWAEGNSPEEAHALLPTIDSLIKNMKITVPET